MDFPSNSKQPAAEPKPDKVIEPVVTNEVIQKKLTLKQRFRHLFLGADFKSTTHYIAVDVLLPATRNMMFDAATKSAERFFYGETQASRPRRPTPGAGGPRVSYQSMQQSRPNTRRGVVREAMPKEGDIVLQTREEAELVHERLIDIIETYEFASVADFHELVNLPSAHTDGKWGWYSLPHSSVRQTREGFIVELPAPEAQ